uniref:Uncharacterized protein n=1 Tax=Pseudictyota dubia TaxID=2749911 RepID=A0A7R9VIC1_9STRA|mmetsp:Transcript_15220/g.29010  ORF Transcript_15220/g.29010 Transcript_15220/m.29010 type:complete len:100 (+) Transcript_15220:199-498(+)
MAAEGGDVDVAGNSIAGGGRLGDGRSGGQNALEETTRTSSGSAGVSRHWQSAAGEGQAAHAYGHDGGAAAAWNSWNSPSPYQAYRGRGGGGGGGRRGGG